jgi:hypothetical protein
MSSEYSIGLPEVFPQREVKVSEEPHLYETFSEDGGVVVEKTDYLLDKAPISEIREVVGLNNGREVIFKEGTDFELAPLIRERQDTLTYRRLEDEYTLTNQPDETSLGLISDSGETFTEDVDFELVERTIKWLPSGDEPNNRETFSATYTVTFEKSVIQWNPDERTPDFGTVFNVTYVSTSVLGRYTESADEQLEIAEESLDDVISSRFLTQASGDELDEIGELFGSIGNRLDRNDQEYRTFLRSVVQSFTSRGTKTGIKLAISATTGIKIENISIVENLQENTYRVVILPKTAVKVSTIERVAEIADPSGVAQSVTTFDIEQDSVSVNDQPEVKEAVTVQPDLFSSLDDALIDPNVTELTERLSVADAPKVNDNLSSTLDDALVGDTVENIETTGKNTDFWEDKQGTENTNWGFFEWTEIIDLSISAPSDGAKSADTLLINPNKFASSDTSQSEDAFEIDANAFLSEDSSQSNDKASVDANAFAQTDNNAIDDAASAIPEGDARTVEGGGSSDNVAKADATLVGWNTNDWGAPNWTVEHN